MKQKPPPVISLPGAFAEWVIGTDAFENKSTTTHAGIQRAFAEGRRRTYGRSYGLFVTLSTHACVEDLKELLEWFESATSDEASDAERRALATVRERLAELDLSGVTQ